MKIQIEAIFTYRKSGNFRYMKFSLKNFRLKNFRRVDVRYENILTRKFYNITFVANSVAEEGKKHSGK